MKETIGIILAVLVIAVLLARLGERLMLRRWLEERKEK